ncbi:MAG TPA: DEAD/DEAH box helicase [Acidimicrobiales bacterium]|jgi:DEAD/DEAH box helicase domain-containing protein|nr:DEAD/DEAH box helicase [Acidimicrobiales bacterium]
MSVAAPVDQFDDLLAVVMTRMLEEFAPTQPDPFDLGAADRIGDRNEALGAASIGGLVHLERMPARDAKLAALSTPLPAAVTERLGVADLWSHQVEAIDLARRGHHVAIATGTASGKSLVYQALVGAMVSDDHNLAKGTALLLHPTKALAHDQLRALTELGFPGVVAAAYDGDCTPQERVWVRRQANAVLTNPDMLHAGILPQHARWATFLRNLRYVVVDELHVLRGIFGSHVAHVLRRLRRLCAHYGSTPTFVFTSATIGDPGGLASALCGLPVDAVTADGSPRGERVFALWNPPLLDPHTGARASTNGQAARLVAELVHRGHRTIAFTRSRKGTELLAADVRRRVPHESVDLVRPYRAGYLASERRQIEAELFGGTLRGVIATTALELGIDVGGLDACILTGFPGTIASMWQQAGRAGREGQPSLAVLVAGNDQLDQYLIAHPDEVFTRPPEPAVVNASNPYVLDPHLACAAYELPLTPADAEWWHTDLEEAMARMVAGGQLRVRRGGVGAVPPAPGRPPVRAIWSGGAPPASTVGLRSGSAIDYRIALADGTMVGTVDEARAFETVHPGAVYLHRGATYRVADLDLLDHTAVVQPTDGGESTQARIDTEVHIIEQRCSRHVGRAVLAMGEVQVRSQVVGYQRRDTFSGEILGNEVLDLPPTTLVTRAFWYTVDQVVVGEAGIAAAALPGSLHAVEHAAIGVLPLFAICDRWDVGGVSTAGLADTGLPTIVIYDGYSGGAGIADLGYDAADRHLAATLDVLAACPCRDGCPSCVQSPKCGNGNEPLDKVGAIRLLTTILDRG